MFTKLYQVVSNPFAKIFISRRADLPKWTQLDPNEVELCGTLNKDNKRASKCRPKFHARRHHTHVNVCTSVYD